MICDPCRSAMVTRLTHSLPKEARESRAVPVPRYKVTSTCPECGVKVDVGHIT